MLMMVNILKKSFRLGIKKNFLKYDSQKYFNFFNIYWIKFYHRNVFTKAFYKHDKAFNKFERSYYIKTNKKFKQIFFIIVGTKIIFNVKDGKDFKEKALKYVQKSFQNIAYRIFKKMFLYLLEKK